MKKFLSLSLAFTMGLLVFPFGIFAMSENSNVEQSLDPINRMLEEKFSELFMSGEEEREFIIELDDKEARSYRASDIGIMSHNQVQDNSMPSKALVESRKNIQDQFLDEIGADSSGKQYSVMSLFKKKSSEVKLISSFTYLVNGMTLKLNYDNLSKVAHNPMVKNIYYNAKMERPENDIKPNLVNSGDLIGAGQPKNRAFDGTGRVVAILDSGIDASHPDMKISDPSRAKYDRKAIETISREFGLKGKYLSDKIPYAYNYMDDNFEIKDTTSQTAAHGMHVSGIVAANGKVKGVIPEAQILMMRVFSNIDAKTTVSTYVKALNDAVILGADSVNMSLGNLEEGVENVPLIFTNAVENAIKNGTTVVVSAGNNKYFAERMGNSPWSENPDWGVVATPSIGKDTISVASVENLLYQAPYGLFANEKGEFDRSFEMRRPIKVNNAKTGQMEIPGDFTKGFEYSKEYEYVDCSYGIFDEEYQNPDGSSKVEGKVALILRGYDKENNPEIGETTKWYYNSKIRKAEEFGAVAVVIGNSLNSQEGLYGFRDMTQVEIDTVPSYFINHYSYLELKRFSDNHVMFKENTYVQNFTGGTPSDFSSWGPTADLGIKPEISAPGGLIYSTVNYDSENTDNSYRCDSGTSMAAPHVTAGVAALNKVLDEHQVPKSERFRRAKNLLLSTARPIKVPNEKDLFFSPRIEGAGMMRLDYATNPHFVTVKDNRKGASSYGLSKIEFKDLRGSNTLNFDLVLDSFGTKAGSTSYDVDVYVQTDKIKDGYEVTFEPQHIAKFEHIGKIELSEGEKAEFTKSIDLTEAIRKSNIANDNPNGFLLDGFIVFRPSNPEFSELSVPFLAFSGNWETDPPIIEGIINDMNLEEYLPYFMQNTSVHSIMESIKNYGTGRNFTNNFTHLYSDTKTMDGKKFLVLGYDESEKNLNKNYYISPNGDGYIDYVGFNGVFLRAYKDFKINVKDGNGDVIYKGNILKTHGEKASNLSTKFANKSETHPSWIWNGTDSEGKFANDGTYTFEVSAKMQDREHAQPQIYSYDVIVDTVAPSISEMIEKSGSGNRYKIYLKPYDEVSGIKEVYFSYEYVDWKNNTKTELIPFDRSEDQEGVYYLDPDKNDWHRLAGDSVKSSYKIILVDKAGNRKTYNYFDELGTGKLVLEKANKDGSDAVPNNMVVAIDLDTNKAYEDLSKLNKGNYRVAFKEEPSNYKYKIFIDGEEKDTFTISDESMEVIAKIEFEEIDQSKLGTIYVSVVENKNLKEAYKLYAMDSQGKKYYLSKDVGETTETYSVAVPKGYYTLGIEGLYADGLGQGFDLEENETVKRSIVTAKALDDISFPLTSDDNSEQVIEEFFGDDLVLVGGNSYQLNHPEKYFAIKSSETGSSLDFGRYIEEEQATLGEVKLHKSYDGFSVTITALKDVSYNLDMIGYDGEKFSVGIYEQYGQVEQIDINKKTTSVGSLKINTNIKSEKYKEDAPLVKYSVFHKVGHVKVNDFTKLAPGRYLLEGHADKPNWIMDPNKVEFNVVANMQAEVNADWYYKSPDMHAKPQIRVTIKGYTGPQFKNLKLKFVNRNNSTVKEFAFDENTLSKLISVEFGDYYLEIEGVEEGYIARAVEADYDQYDKSQHAPAKLSIHQLENELTIVLDKGSEEFEITENSLEIIQTYQGETLERPFQYTLKNDEVEYHSAKNEFHNIKTGEYQLIVNTDSTNYIPVEQTIQVSIQKGKNYAVVKFQEAGNITFSSTVLGGTDEVNVIYEAAYADGNQYKVFGQGEFPLGVKLDIYPLYIEESYALATEEGPKDKVDDKGIYKDIVLNKGDNLKFHFVKEENMTYNPYPLYNVNEHAKTLLLDTAKYEDSYVDSLTKAINNANLLLENGGLQEEFDRQKADLINLINYPMYKQGEAISKDELYELVNHLETLDLGLNSKESVEKLEKAMNKAKVLLATELVSKSEIDDMINKLKSLEAELLEEQKDEKKNLDKEAKIKDLLSGFDNMSLWQKKDTLKQVYRIKDSMTRTPSLLIERLIEEAERKIRKMEEDVDKEIKSPDYDPGRIFVPRRDKNKKADMIKNEDKQETNQKLENKDSLSKDLLIPEIDSSKEVVFTDIMGSKYFSDIINTYRRGLLNGVSDDRFAPQGKVTRAQAIAILYRLTADKTYTENGFFKDVTPGIWYEEISKWALAKGISKGDDLGNFNGDQVITREELAALLFRFLKTRLIFEHKEFEYQDIDLISEWALEAVEKLNSLDILKGWSTEKYEPKGAVMREELAHVLENIIKNLTK